MSKKALLSALLISSFAFSNVFAADVVNPAPPTGAQPAAAAAAESTEIVGFKDCTFSAFPLTSSAKTGAAKLSFLNCSLEALDSSFFVNNPTLRELAFVESSINFSIFAGGTFGKGCTRLEALNLKAIKNLTFEQFLAYASSDLLDRIVAESCKLKFSRAGSGATLARFSTNSNSEELTPEEIKRYISMYRTAQAAASSSTTSATAATPTPANGGGVLATLWAMFGSSK
ncbi:hypothetical protein [Candidatus Bodocaedibacter vickermanii]|uniref:Pentapeptide repeat-containing protein n=1 Tax=Candidatus Bodocaedibacter vickermanii TaxID=2741701 RepID=A0A7L9RTC6_9PROT|nr:hypothetical protein CPBP_00382 [Candidatus Paracaedibacteraceae bacterium 'Lake Konstanz']